MGRTSPVIVMTVLALAVGSMFTGRTLSASEGSIAAAGNKENGKAIYQRTCTACHGDKAQGDLTFNAPKLAGQEDWYMKRQLENFAQGIRGAEPRDLYGAQMRPMALTLTSEQEILDVIAYITSLPK